MRTPDGLRETGWGVGVGGSTRLILISSVSLGRNTSGWDPMEGTRSLHVPFPNFCSFPHCFPVNLGWIQNEFFPRFFMPFMKTRSAFNAFLWPTPVFFFSSLFCSSSHCRLSCLSVGGFSARLNSR